MNLDSFYSDFSVREAVFLILPLFLGAAAVCATLALWSKMRTASRAFLCAGVVSGYGAMVITLLQKTGFFEVSAGMGHLSLQMNADSLLSLCFFALSVLSPLCIVCACIFFLAEDSRG